MFFSLTWSLFYCCWIFLFLLHLFFLLTLADVLVDVIPKLLRIRGAFSTPKSVSYIFFLWSRCSQQQKFHIQEFSSSLLNVGVSICLDVRSRTAKVLSLFTPIFPAKTIVPVDCMAVLKLDLCNQCRRVDILFKRNPNQMNIFRK